MPSMNDRAVGRDMIWGMKWGLVMGLIYTLFASVVVFAKEFQDSAVSQHVEIPLLLAAYPVTGVMAGLIVGLFRPLLVSRTGAVIVGVMAAVPVTLAFVRLVRGPLSGLATPEWIGAGGAAILLGSMGGYIWWGQMSGFDPGAALRYAKERQGRRSRPRRETARDEPPRDRSSE